jgi:hypothetical protein
MINEICLNHWLLFGGTFGGRMKEASRPMRNLHIHCSCENNLGWTWVVSEEHCVLTEGILNSLFPRNSLVLCIESMDIWKHVLL